jgi:hypothetical protein
LAYPYIVINVDGVISTRATPARISAWAVVTVVASNVTRIAIVVRMGM